MNVLMLGWELPPHITGGLGTACYGLLAAMHASAQHDVTFVVPRLHGDEDTRLARLLQADPALGEEERDAFLGDLHASGIEANEVARPVVGRIEDFSSEAEFLSAHFRTYFEKNGGAVTGTTEGPMLRARGLSDDLFHTPGSVYESHSICNAVDYAANIDLLIGRAGHFDVIHAHDWLTFIAAAAAKSISGKPLVVHIHSTEVDRSAGQGNDNIFRLEQFGMRVADVVVAVSQFTRQVIINKYGIDPAKVVVVHNGTDARPECSNSRYICGQERVVSFIGRITQQKGPKFFIEAAHKVCAKLGDVKFVMAGTGDLLPMAKALVSALGMQEQFAFPGFLDADGVRDLLARSHVYVMPSVSEPFGIGALEAIHAGVPVVVSRQSGVSETVDSMIKADARDSTAIADAIVAILQNEEFARRLADSARAEAKNVTWAAAAEKLSAVYRSVAQRGMKTAKSSELTILLESER